MWICPDPAASRYFPPEVAFVLTKIACEMPKLQGVPLAQWDCKELARHLVASEVVESISAETVRRILAGCQLKPWRQHMWLSSKVPRDEAFAAAIRNICELYTRPLGKHEVVLCVDEKTNIQPRGRMTPTLPARPGEPVYVEHEYGRDGALNLLAAFNTRTGEVIGWNACNGLTVPLSRPRRLPAQRNEYSPCPRQPSRPQEQSRQSLARSARLPTLPPVHCSWMNQVEQWFSILQRKALRIADFESTLALDRHLHQFIAHWNRNAHPFNWSTKSVAKVLAARAPP